MAFFCGTDVLNLEGCETEGTRNFDRVFDGLIIKYSERRNYNVFIIMQKQSLTVY